MKYEGPLYGKIGRKYIPLRQTSESVDSMAKEIDELRSMLGQAMLWVYSSPITSRKRDRMMNRWEQFTIEHPPTKNQ